jgi:hypothetical protein
MEVKSEKPMGLAIVICERIITEALTNNKTIVGTYNTVRTSGFPVRPPGMAIYVSLTNTTGSKKIEMRATHSRQEIGRFGAVVEFSGPSHVFELIFNLKDMFFPYPGLYTFEIFADDEYIFESRVNVVEENERPRE